MADDVKMVVVDGVRYREEDAPKQEVNTDAVATEVAAAETKSRRVSNKARTASDK